MQSRFSLDFPKITICVDDPIPCNNQSLGESVNPGSCKDRAKHVTSGRTLPNKSHDRLLKKSPFPKMPSFLSTNSKFVGSLITTPEGKDGTEISNVSRPNCRSHFANHAKSLCLACKNNRPLPIIGNVFGGWLKSCQRLKISGLQGNVECTSNTINHTQQVVVSRHPASGKMPEVRGSARVPESHAVAT